MPGEARLAAVEVVEETVAMATVLSCMSYFYRAL